MRTVILKALLTSTLAFVIANCARETPQPVQAPRPYSTGLIRNGGEPVIRHYHASKSEASEHTARIRDIASHIGHNQHVSIAIDRQYVTVLSDAGWNATAMLATDLVHGEYGRCGAVIATRMEPSDAWMASMNRFACQALIDHASAHYALRFVDNTNIIEDFDRQSFEFLADSAARCGGALRISVLNTKDTPLAARLKAESIAYALRQSRLLDDPAELQIEIASKPIPRDYRPILADRIANGEPSIIIDFVPLIGREAENYCTPPAP
jgi:hypothetical protein